jgi:hypothetical protein
MRNSIWRRSRLVRGLAIAPFFALGMAMFPSLARAENMISKFIRIDSEPSTDAKGTPVIPMLVELGVPVPINSFQDGCFVGGKGSAVSAAALKCMSDKIEKEGYEKQFEFPKDNANVLALVDGTLSPMEIVDASPFKDATAPNAGIAWLILMDASSSVSASRWAEEQDAAEQIIKAMQPNDAVEVRIMDDKSTRVHTNWLSASKKNDAITKIRSVPQAFSSGGAVDGLISRIEKESIGSFQDLVKSGVDGNEDVIPILQSVVVLSDGGDSSGAGFAGGQTAQILHEKLAKGEGMSEFTRLPIPVVSLWFPDPKLAGGLGNFDEVKANNAFEWMSNLATTEVGGYFDIIQQGEVGKGAKIARVIRTRFDNMYYLQAKAACLDTSGEQTFTIGFTETKSKILPDKWTKIGVAYNFAKWVLSVDKKKTEEAAKIKPLQPGETFDVFGDFCWGSNQGQAEAYFLTEADAPDVKKATADKTGAKGKALLQSLAAKGQKAETVSVTPLGAKFRVPNTPALFPDNKGDSFNLNLVIFDNKQKRVSTLDQKGVFQMKAQKAPVNKLLIVGAIGGGVVLILLIAILARSGGGGNGRSKKRRGGAPPPGPMPGQPPGPRTDEPQPQVALIGAAAGFPAPQYRPVAAVVPPLPPMAPVGVPQPMPPPAQQTYVAPEPIVHTAAAPMPMPPAPMQPAPNVGRTEFVPPPQQAAPLPSQAMQATAIAKPTPPPQNYGPSQADVTIPPQGAVPMIPAQPPVGLHAQQKGATSFPTTCPNPACRKQVLIPPGGTAQCAFCGTLVDASGVAAAPIPAAGGFGLTGHVSPEAADLAAKNAPKAAGSTAMLQGDQGAPAIVAATLVGNAGNFRILPGIESRAGRDGTLCSIALTEARVSGVHATLKLERNMLLVRDDRSHNGTFVNGNRIPPGSWTPVPGGSQLRFGPVEFTVRHEF